MPENICGMEYVVPRSSLSISRVTLMILASIVLVAGCGGPERDGGGHATTTTTRAKDRAARVPERAFPQIYGAVIREAVGDAQRPVLVVDHPVEDAGDAEGDRGAAGTPFTRRERALIEHAAGEGLDLRWVASDDDAIDRSSSCAVVRGHGTLVTLDTPRGTARRALVGVESFMACLGAEWKTLVVEPTDGSWRVTGSTGPVAIA